MKNWIRDIERRQTHSKDLEKISRENHLTTASEPGVSSRNAGEVAKHRGKSVD